MGLLRDEHTVDIAGSTVVVRGATGAVHATWTLLVDGAEVDRVAAAGEFRLRGALADGSAVEAAVFQSLLGPTRVTVSHAGVEVLNAEGFVA